VLEEWNNYHPNKTYVLDELYIASVNKEIAYWYMNVRIPQMLRYYGIEDTVENRLISYNAGVSYVFPGKKLPNETVGYLKKYHKQKEL